MSNHSFIIMFTLVALIVGGIFYFAYPTPHGYESSSNISTTTEAENLFRQIQSMASTTLDNTAANSIGTTTATSSTSTSTNIKNANQ